MSKTTVRNAIIALVLIVTAVSVLGVMIYQVMVQGDKLAVQIEVLEGERTQEVSYNKLKRVAKETVSEREQLLKHFLQQEGDSINFLTLIESTAPEFGINLQIQPDGLGLVEGEGGDTEWIKVDFSFSGSREQIQGFIDVLENLPYVLRLTNIDMKVRSSTRWNAEATVQVRVLEYDK